MTFQFSSVQCIISIFKISSGDFLIGKYLLTKFFHLYTVTLQVDFIIICKHSRKQCGTPVHSNFEFDQPSEIENPGVTPCPTVVLA